MTTGIIILFENGWKPTFNFSNKVNVLVFFKVNVLKIPAAIRITFCDMVCG